MSPWPFILAAYAVTVGGAASLLVASFFSMRRAERRADALRRERP